VYRNDIELILRPVLGGSKVTGQDLDVPMKKIVLFRNRFTLDCPCASLVEVWIITVWLLVSFSILFSVSKSRVNKLPLYGPVTKVFKKPRHGTSERSIPHMENVKQKGRER